MARRCHYIQGNKSNEQPNNIVWFDTETKFKVRPDKRQYHYLWFGWACYQRRSCGEAWSQPQWYRFTSIDDFWTWCLDRARAKTRLYLMSHNGAFDLPVMHTFTELPARGFRLTSAIADAPPMILSWRCDKRTIKYVDTLNIWRLPLAKVGKSIGIAKLPMPKPNASKAAWDEYGKQDVEVIRQATIRWLRFLRANDLGGFSPTLASQAFKAYRHRFMPCKILIDTSIEPTTLAREAYLGGRCECFRIGTYRGEFYYLDVNSMYPSVMRDGYFPCKLLDYCDRPTHKELAKWLRTRAVVCDCVIDTREPAYPVLHQGRLCFPTGRFRCALTSPELEYALAQGHIVSMAWAAIYERAQLFKGFVDFSIGERHKAIAAGNETDSWFFKRMGNSLYGKFGQRGRRYDECDICDPNEVQVWTDIDLDSGEVKHYRKFGGIVQHWIDEGESRESFPAIAAHVTAYARQKLYAAIRQAGRRNCLYCDTDSLVVNRTGYSRL
ncbi:MAG: DNA polymerase, partial [Woeseia sp.]